MAQVNQDPKYIVEPNQVRSPTLLIGIGGIGGHIIKGVYDSMSEYDRTYVEMVVMDTNTNDLDKFMNTGIRTVQTSENKTVQSYLEANEEYAVGFPVNPLINAKNLADGAGQIRAVSRLGALASKAAGKFSVIDDAIDTILTNHGDALQRAVRVMIVGSSTGGTGSGLGVQLPFYVRNALKRKNVPVALVRGLFIMPSLTEEAQETEASEKAVNVNGYAFLKEINAFYRLQMADAEENLLSIEEYEPGVKTATVGGKSLAAAGSIPYDFLFLVEKYSEKGSIGGLGDYIARSVQIVMNQLFSPVAGTGFSKEDNLIISAVSKNGMSRYCGAGVSNAIYPVDEVIRYCTVRYAGELIKGYWLQIDDEFRRRDEQQRRLRKTNPNLAALDRGDTFCQIFDDMCDPNKHAITGELTSLQNELVVNMVKDDGTKESKSLNDCMTQYIEAYLNTVFANSGLAKEAERCKMSSTKMNIPAQAEMEVSSKMSRLTAFRTNAEETISKLVLSTAEDILPSDLALGQSASKDAKHNIFISLREKHPIVARYVLYGLRKALREMKQASDERLQERYNRESIFTKDYYREKGKDTHREAPAEALSKTSAGLLSFAGLNSAAYSRLTRMIMKDASDEAAHIQDMAEHTLKSTAYRIVLERLDLMIELYERFFEELRNIMQNKIDEADRLEVGKGAEDTGAFKGDKYICCNAQCKRALYDEFQSKISEEDKEMSPEVKLGFFEKMFAEYTVMLTKLTDANAYVKSMSLPQLFEEGVLQPITAQFRRSGFRHLDMSILDAIKKQYEIEHKCKVARNDPEYVEYFRKLCNSLKILATPYLSYNTEVKGYVSGGKLAYAWGVNHSSVAVYQNGSAEQGVDMQLLGDMFKGDNCTPVPDNSFSPYSLVCYATIYDLQIENCSKYRTGEVAQKCYSERLRNVVDQTYVISDAKDGYLEVVHPHLDCRWHERAYLPELMDYDDKKMRQDTRISFMMAVCLGLCDYWEEKSEGLQCWWYRHSGAKHSSPVFVNDSELRTASVFALYKAFDCNRVIVEDVQNVIAAEKREAYQSRPLAGVTEESVIAQKIIQALIGNGKGKRNVLDMLYMLLQDSGNRKELELAITALEAYLESYCLMMANDNANRAGVLCAAVRKAIGAGSVALASEDTSKIFKESCDIFCN